MISFLASMKFKLTNRQILTAAIIIFYLVPLLFFSSLNMSMMPHTKSWALFSLGLLLSVIGTFALTVLLYYWEQSLSEKSNLSSDDFRSLQEGFFSVTQNKVTALESTINFEKDINHEEENEPASTVCSKEFNLLETTIKTNQERIEQLTQALERHVREMEKQNEDNKELELKALQISQDFADYKLFSEEQLKQKNIQLSAFQQMMEDQRTEMEKRQEQIYQLDTKVHDLSYEIKTLLHLNEAEPAQFKYSAMPKESEYAVQPLPRGEASENAEHVSASSQTTSHELLAFEKPIKTPIEATALLRKCINMAQKLTGAHYHANETSRYREFSPSFYGIDQRRLFDNLRGELGALIIVYSQKENKLLFANNESKALLGWSPEKFVADFSSIVHEGINDWKKALSMLANATDSQARLLAKSKQGQEIILNCQLGIIPTGLFRNYVIGILYPA